MLPTSYFHLVFTLPEGLRPLALRNQKVVYNLLFKSGSETLIELARDSKHLGAEIGFMVLLHTWSQTLIDHPHLHCLVPGGGLSLDGKRFHSRLAEPLYRAHHAATVAERVAHPRQLPPDLQDAARFDRHAVFRQKALVVLNQVAKGDAGGSLGTVNEPPPAVRTGTGPVASKGRPQGAVGNHRINQLFVAQPLCTRDTQEHLHGLGDAKLAARAQVMGCVRVGSCPDACIVPGSQPWRALCVRHSSALSRQPGQGASGSERSKRRTNAASASPKTASSISSLPNACAVADPHRQLHVIAADNHDVGTSVEPRGHVLSHAADGADVTRRIDRVGNGALGRAPCSALDRRSGELAVSTTSHGRSDPGRCRTGDRCRAEKGLEKRARQLPPAQRTPQSCQPMFPAPPVIPSAQVHRWPIRCDGWCRPESCTKSIDGKDLRSSPP